VVTQTSAIAGWRVCDPVRKKEDEEAGMRSLLYQHIWLYRGVMQILYRGRAAERYRQITQLVGSDVHSVVELCFGDTAVAEFCKGRGIHWEGYDLSENFVERARALGFEAHLMDIATMDRFPKCDLIIMLGSLYHFPHDLDTLFQKIFEASPRLVLSEAVLNLASSGGLIGRFSKIMTDAGSGPEVFRFSRSTLMTTLQQQAERLSAEILEMSDRGREIIVVMQRV